MFSFGFMILFRRRGSFSPILALALLVAILTSVASILNYVSYRIGVLEGSVNISETYLILGKNSSALIDSQIDADLSSLIGRLSSIEYIFAQKLLTVPLMSGSGAYTATLRGVDDVGGFLKFRGAYVNGSFAKDVFEVNVGEILARAFSIKVGDKVTLSSGNGFIEVKVVGIVRTRSQCDVELIASMDTVKVLAEDDGKISFIEFKLKDGVNSKNVLANVVSLLPNNARLVHIQQLKEFVKDMDVQTLSFLSIWSIIVYATIALTSFTVSARLVIESEYEFTMLKALGAKRKHTITLIIAYIVAATILGSILGVALGLVGTQMVSTFIWWFWASFDILPFLEFDQALHILLFTLASSVLGCLYPAYMSARTRYVEQLL